MGRCDSCGALTACLDICVRCAKKADKKRVARTVFHVKPATKDSR